MKQWCRMGLIFKGLQNTWQKKKFIAILWVINFLFAGLFLIPYNSTFRNFFSNRMVMEILAEQNIYTFYAEFYYWMDSAVSSSVSWIQMGNLIHYLLIMVLTGGFISALGMKGKNDLKRFWRECLEFGPRMILFGLITPVLLGVLLLVALAAGLPFVFFLPDYFVEDHYFYFLVFLCVLILVFILGGWLILDLAKIRIIEGKDQSIGRSLMEALRHFIYNPIRIFGYYLGVFLLWVIFLAGYWFLQHHLSDRSMGGIFLEFILLQVAIWCQLWIRFSRYDVLMQLMQKRSINPV